ncbi:MAG: methyltransferase domain-containing protein [Candidatus Scalindua sp. AMX11]|nr:MAG: methyltransferase domain-containing protein [Candidatus Scalindua sp.]NOG85861.1 methyltransferase domain-containing protein [Planctomycetota bacterium]RZV96967.1 MAG: methyltransferase domain-containing protein [Candidatus Scalindua sp. SCAELEC01]TDE66421.1 MAG: methyltransferase domain-containing protein [Candidatus Scalindua sp. AMX11]GJQ58188.1 MAG: SAM-dependent methyltransferase [Candidatus Scalindua sp.]
MIEEMRKYTSPLNIDYETKYGDEPRRDLIQFITVPPQRVLEIGCGAGATGAALKQKFHGVEYTGLESEENVADIARTRLDKVFTGSIEKVQLQSFGLSKEYFDIIICGDVLEHLYDPWKTLSLLHDYLKPKGVILLSIPNVQNINNIINLINGHWTYRENGLLDATHIRFFTLQEIVKMLSGTGYKLTQCKGVMDPKLQSDTWPKNFNFGNFEIKNMTQREAFNFSSFQYLIVAQKSVAQPGGA